jgi:hypothetical protein
MTMTLACQIDRPVDIMSDEDDGTALAAPGVQQLILHADAGQRIQAPKGSSISNIVGLTA